LKIHRARLSRQYWADNTGRTVQELNQEWVARVHEELEKLKSKG